MMRVLHRGLCLVLAAVLALAVPVTPAFAAESSPLQAAQTSLAPQAATSEMTLSVPYPHTRDEYTPTVQVDSPIACGSETVFKVIANPKMSNVKYYFNSCTVADSESAFTLIDLSWGSNGYQASNAFPVTFMASGTYCLRFYVMGKPEGQETFDTRMVEVRLVIRDPAYPTTEAVADNVAAQCLAAGCKTDYEKALWLHDWIVDHCTYDNSFLYCNAEGALVRGIGTCEAYHRAYEMLLHRVGIQTGRMEGNGHVWTAVRMDGRWYQVDVTWDDPGAGDYIFGIEDKSHLYFGLNDEIMGYIHSAHSAPVDGYESNSLAQNYFIKSGRIRHWSDPYESKVQAALQAKKGTFTFPADNSDWPADYKNNINRVVAYQLSSQAWKVGSQAVTLKVSYRDDVFTCAATYEPVKPVTPTTPTTPEKPPTPSRIDISKAAIMLTPASYTFDGKAKRPAVTVRYGGKTLRAGTDYQVRYANNIGRRDAKTTATATVVGVGAYTGSATRSFTINAVPASKPSTGATAKPADNAVVRVPMHRVFNKVTGEHFYTASDAELKSLTTGGNARYWKYEGDHWSVPKKSSKPVYRLCNPVTGDHHYTMDKNEYLHVRNVLKWRDEGIGWYSEEPSKGTRLMRLNNPRLPSGAHHFVINPAERDQCKRQGWIDEGYAWYVCK